MKRYLVIADDWDPDWTIIEADSPAEAIIRFKRQGHGAAAAVGEFLWQKPEVPSIGQMHAHSLASSGIIR